MALRLVSNEASINIESVCNSQNLLVRSERCVKKLA